MKVETKFRVAIAALLAVTLVAGFMTAAHAQTACPPSTEWNKANVCWTNPTQNTDNTPIPTTCQAGATFCGKLASTRVEYGTCLGTAPNQTFGTKVGEITIANPTATQAQLSVTVPQVYCIRTMSKNDFTVESVPSNVVVRTFSAPQPKPPVMVTEATAFDIRRNSAGDLVAQRIGVVRPGTQCYGDKQQTVAGVTYTQIPREAVDIANFSNGPDAWAPVVWAKCGA